MDYSLTKGIKTPNPPSNADNDGVLMDYSLTKGIKTSFED